MTAAALKKLYPQLKYQLGERLYWDAKQRTIYYREDVSKEALYGLLHETAHALLGHEKFSHDVQLIKMERDAWIEAQAIASAQGLDIPEEYVEACLDTYRDWLYARSTCPNCALAGFQTAKNHYACIFCHAQWKVPASRLCAVRRTLVATKN